jgi:hypothetical protein
MRSLIHAAGMSSTMTRNPIENSLIMIDSCSQLLKRSSKPGSGDDEEDDVVSI